MTTRLIILVVLAVAAVVVALILQRRRPDPPSAPSYRAPSQLDRDDFQSPNVPVLAVVFASATCNTCPVVWEALRPMASSELAVQRINVEDDPSLHKRYKIDGVPTTVMANHEGVVAKAFFGPIADGELEQALAALGVEPG